MKHIFSGIMLGIGVALVIPVCAQAPLMLSYTPQKGSTVYYNGNLVINTGKSVVTISQRYHVTISAVNTDGSFDQTLTYDKYEMKSDQGSQPLPTPPPLTLSYESTGLMKDKTLTSSDPSMDPGIAKILMLTTRPILSAKPVSPGDKWTTTLDDPEVKGQKITVEDTFVKVGMNAGLPVWKVKQTVSAPVSADGTVFTSKNSFVMDAKTGGLIMDIGHVTNLVTLYGNLSADITLVRVPAPGSPGTQDPAKSSTTTLTTGK